MFEFLATSHPNLAHWPKSRIFSTLFFHNSFSKLGRNQFLNSNSTTSNVFHNFQPKKFFGNISYFISSQCDNNETFFATHEVKTVTIVTFYKFIIQTQNKTFILRFQLAFKRMIQAWGVILFVLQADRVSQITLTEIKCTQMQKFFLRMGHENSKFQYLKNLKNGCILRDLRCLRYRQVFKRLPKDTFTLFHFKSVRAENWLLFQAAQALNSSQILTS